MTTQEKLQAITANIREKLPRMMWLEEGCIIKDKGTDAIGKILCIKGKDYLIEWLDSTYRYLKYDVCCDDYVQNRFRSLGKEPMITDVLEWVYKVSDLARKSKELQVSFDGYFCVYDHAWGKTEMCRVSWDLSKPYLKDQSEEVIDFLYKFVKEENDGRR